MNKKAIVAGHICLDITPVMEKRTDDATGVLLTPGKLIEVGGAHIAAGGAASNTGLAMKLFGADVRIAGRIGGDAFGDLLQKILEKEGAGGDLTVDKHGATSYSCVIAPPGVDRIFLHHPGVNRDFGADDVDFDRYEDSALFHFGYPTIVRRMYQDGGAELLDLYRRAKERHIATSMDLSMVDPDSEAGRVDWKQVLARVMPYVDFFAPSVEELCYMLDKNHYRRLLKKADGRDITEIIDIDRDVRPLADTLLHMGAKVVLIKCGVPGIYYRTADRERIVKIGGNVENDFADWSDMEGFERSYVPPSEVVSGTGAGDVSIAAFLTAVLYGYSLKRCIRLAAAAGAMCVTQYDALGGLRSFAEMEEKIKQGWKKQ